jgi:hypothetical protein
MMQRTKIFILMMILQKLGQKPEPALSSSVGECVGFRDVFLYVVKQYILNDEACDKLLSIKD